MPQTNINIRLDQDLKREFDEVCKDVGLTMTGAFTVFAKAVVMQQKIPFEIKRKIPNDETRAAIDELKEIEKEPSRCKQYDDVEAMIKDILPEAIKTLAEGKELDKR